MAQAISRQPFVAGDRVSPRDIRGVLSFNGIGFSPSSLVLPVSIFSPVLHNHFLHIALTRKTNDQSLETVKSGSTDYERNFTFTLSIKG
jgi:hypothetical protein